MKEKILALLLANYSGVRKDGLAQLAGAMALHATTEEEAKTIVDKLTADQVNDFIKDFRRSVDKEVSESNETYKENLKKKFDFVDKGKGTPPDDGTDPDKKTDSDPTDIQAIIKNAIAEAVAPLKTELETFKGQKTNETRLQKLSGKLSSCNDEVFKIRVLKDFGRMKDMSEEEFDEYLTETETDIVTVNQNVVNSSLSNFGRPTIKGNQGNSKEASDEELDAVMEKLPI